MKKIYIGMLVTLVGAATQLDATRCRPLSSDEGCQVDQQNTQKNVHVTASVPTHAPDSKKVKKTSAYAQKKTKKADKKTKVAQVSKAQKVKSSKKTKKLTAAQPMPVKKVKKSKKASSKPKKAVIAHTPIRERLSKIRTNVYGNFAYGFVKYLVPKRTWFTSTCDVVDGEVVCPDGAVTLSTNHTSMMPLFRAGLGYEFTGIPCLLGDKYTRTARLGLEVSFAKKSDAYKGTYDNLGGTEPGAKTVYQDIARGTFMIVGSYDLYKYKPYEIGLTLDTGMGLIGGSLKNFKLYDFNTKLYRGQTLPVHKAAFGGFVGMSFTKRFSPKSSLEWDLSYRAVFNHVRYQNYFIQENGVPGSSTYADPAPLSTPQDIAYRTGYGNKVLVIANEVTLSIVKEI